MHTIVDAHQHVGVLTDATSYSGSTPGPAAPIEQEVDTRVARMDAHGIAWSVVQPAHGYLRPDGIADTVRVNDRMARFHELAADRFRAVGTSEPMHGERGLAEIDRIHAIGLAGVSWHHRFQGCFIDSRWMWPTLERMGELGLVPMVHVNPESSLEAHWRLQRLALDFFDLTFVALDALWSYEGARHVLTTAARTPNVVWDLGGPKYVSIGEWVERNGSATICFSMGASYSAAGGSAPPPLLTEIEQAGISESERADILGGNVTRALGAPPRTGVS